MKLEFRPEEATGRALMDWWEGLQQDTGGRARLRRCSDPEEVMLEPAFHRLLQRIRTLSNQSGGEITEHDIHRLAAVAGLLAHVKARHQRPLAEQMAESGAKGDRPPLSPLRFRRLIKEPFDDLYPAMRRVIAQLDKKANIHDLADSVFYWGDRVRKRWALVYFSRVAD